MYIGTEENTFEDSLTSSTKIISSYSLTSNSPIILPKNNKKISEEQKKSRFLN